MGINGVVHQYINESSGNSKVERKKNITSKDKTSTLLRIHGTN